MALKHYNQAADAAITTKALSDIFWDSLVVCREVFSLSRLRHFIFHQDKTEPEPLKKGKGQWSFHLFLMEGLI